MTMVMLSPFSDASAGMHRLRQLAGNMDVKFILPKQDKYGISPENSRFYFPVEKRSFLALPIYIARAVSYLNSQKPDVVYFYKPHPFTFFPAFIYKLLHPECQTILLDLDEWESATMKDNGELYHKRIFMDILSKLSIHFADKIIYTNHYLIDDKIPSEKWHRSFYIPNGVDTNEFKPRKHKKGKYFVVMFVGLLRNIKRILPVVDAAKIASKKIPNIQCVIIGEGSKRKELEQLVDSKGLGKFFAFYGKVPQERLLKLLPMADILIAPFPDLEGLHYQSNLKIFEYMAVGVPIIASDVGEISKYLEDGEAGYVIKPDSPEAIAEAIINVYSHPKEAKQKADYARKMSVEKNDWKFRTEKLDWVIKRKILESGLNMSLGDFIHEIPMILVCGGILLRELVMSPIYMIEAVLFKTGPLHFKGKEEWEKFIEDD